MNTTKPSHQQESPVKLLHNDPDNIQPSPETGVVFPLVSNPSTPAQENQPSSARALTQLTNADRIAAIDTLMAHAATEQEIYWQRSTIFLTLNSIMLGFAATSTQSLGPLAILVLTGFGLYFNSAWRSVLIYGQFFADRWKHDARAIAESDEALTEAYRALVNIPRMERPNRKKPSRIMKEISFLFQAAWLGIGLYGTSSIWLNSVRRGLSALLNTIK